jgi:hypothetical protein
MHIAGSFIRNLNLQGMSNVSDRALSTMAFFALQHFSEPEAVETSITTLNLTGKKKKFTQLYHRYLQTEHDPK